MRMKAKKFDIQLSGTRSVTHIQSGLLFQSVSKSCLFAGSVGSNEERKLLKSFSVFRADWPSCASLLFHGLFAHFQALTQSHGQSSVSERTKKRIVYRPPVSGRPYGGEVIHIRRSSQYPVSNRLLAGCSI